MYRFQHSPTIHIKSSNYKGILDLILAQEDVGTGYTTSVADLSDTMRSDAEFIQQYVLYLYVFMLYMSYDSLLGGRSTRVNDFVCSYLDNMRLYFGRIVRGEDAKRKIHDRRIVDILCNVGDEFIPDYDDLQKLIDRTSALSILDESFLKLLKVWLKPSESVAGKITLYEVCIDYASSQLNLCGQCMATLDHKGVDVSKGPGYLSHRLLFAIAELKGVNTTSVDNSVYQCRILSALKLPYSPKYLLTFGEGVECYVSADIRNYAASVLKAYVCKNPYIVFPVSEEQHKRYQHLGRVLKNDFLLSGLNLFSEPTVLAKEDAEPDTKPSSPDSEQSDDAPEDGADAAQGTTEDGGDELSDDLPEDEETSDDFSSDDGGFDSSSSGPEPEQPAEDAADSPIKLDTSAGTVGEYMFRHAVLQQLKQFVTSQAQVLPPWKLFALKTWCDYCLFPADIAETKKLYKLLDINPPSIGV